MKYNIRMKNKTQKLLIIIFIITLFSAVFFGCDKKQPATVKEEVKIIAMFDYPKQYYVEGEALELAGGTVFVSTINADGVKGKEGYKIIDLADPEVTVSFPGMAVISEVKTAVVTYQGFKTSFKYYVSTSEKAIESVKFSVDVNEVAPGLLYAVSTNRKNPDFNDLYFTVKYRDSKFEDMVIYIADIPSYSSAGLTLSGFDVTEVGSKIATLSYLATDYTLNYDVVKDDWIDYVEIATSEKKKIQQNYFVGDGINLGGAKFTVEYNSGKSEEKAISAANVTGFDTSAVAKGNKLFFAVTDILGGAETFTYNVYDPLETAAMAGITKYKGLGDTIGRDTLKYQDSLTYKEFLSANIFRIIMEEGNGASYVEVDGSNENFVVTKKSDGSVFDEAAYKAALNDSQSIVLNFTYGNDAELVAEVTLNVSVAWASTKITGWNYNFSVIKDGKFNFGDAKLIKVLENGKEIEISIQEEFEKAVGKRLINIWDSRSLQVASFDTSTVGEGYTLYSIGVVGNVTVNGVAYDHHDSGKLFITYSVTEN